MTNRGKKGGVAKRKRTGTQALKGGPKGEKGGLKCREGWNVVFRARRKGDVEK